jgi:hypothetical protein
VDRIIVVAHDLAVRVHDPDRPIRGVVRALDIVVDAVNVLSLIDHAPTPIVAPVGDP